MKLHRTLSIKLTISILLLLCAPAVSALAAPQKVAILPFTIHADKDYTFLQKGITAMLASRLAAPNAVVIIDPAAAAQAVEGISGFSGDSLALLAGGKLNANYVLYGSLTVLGQSVSIDAKMLDVTGAKPPFAFFQQAQSMNEVIPHINRFASEINANVFGRGLPAKPATAPVTPAAPATGAGTVAGAAAAGAAATTPPTPDPRMHPEKLVTHAPPAPAGNDTANRSSINSAFITSPAARTRQAFWKSRTFRQVINGIAVADVDGDGQMETVLAMPHQVVIYRARNDQIVKIFESEKHSSLNLIAVDAGDINGNGRAEIFVTAQTFTRNALRSFVLEFDGKTFTPVVEKEAMYYRVMAIAGRGDVLFGQRQKAGAETVFSEPIYELAWQNNGYEPSRRVLPGRKANLLGFAYGDITGEDRPRAIVYTDVDKLRIIGTTGEARWKGEEKFGGSTLYFNVPKTDAGQLQSLQYYPMRLRTADLDGNGKLELIVAKNYDVAGGMMQTFRNFKDFQFESLSWDGLGLASNWKTRKTTGMIRDFAIGDFDQDGKKELVAVVIMSEGRVATTKPRTALIAYELN